MKAAFLDFGTLGSGDVDPGPLRRVVTEIRLFDDSSAAQIPGRVRDAGILVVNKIAVDEAVMAAAPDLRLICLAATGTDNVAMDAARSRGIGVANIRDYCAPSVTQHVFALILALNQHLREYDSLLKSGAWERSNSFCLLDHRFHELAGKTLGIIGLGNLGRSVAQVARAFGMEVLAAQRPYRPIGPIGHAGNRTVPPDISPGIRRVEFPELLARSHVISLHCPLTDETRGLVNADALAHMRRDALLINTARGALVDGAALLAALGNGTIAGAGIDVLEREPPVNGHPLLRAALPNLLVTPHMAWAARESRQRALDEIALNVQAFLAGQRRNRVD